jgi:hypothetical protein
VAAYPQASRCRVLARSPDRPSAARVALLRGQAGSLRGHRWNARRAFAVCLRLTPSTSIFCSSPASGAPLGQSCACAKIRPRSSGAYARSPSSAQSALRRPWDGAVGAFRAIFARSEAISLCRVVCVRFVCARCLGDGSRCRSRMVDRKYFPTRLSRLIAQVIPEIRVIPEINQVAIA